MPTGPLAALTALLLPRECGGCGVPDTAWCQSCAAFLARATARPWLPTPVRPGLPPTLAALPYAGPVRQALVALKDGGRHDLVGPLAAALRCALAPALELAGRCGGGDGEVWVVPVPSAATAVRRRGERPTTLLAARGLRQPHPLPGRARVVPALRLARRTEDQAGLDAAARAANLGGAMTVPARWRAGVAGRAVVVVDDVVTTGATLAEGARALRSAGSGTVLAATVAATVRRRHGA